MEGNQRKGLSKGCMVGLIVAGVIIVIIAIGFITCWVYKDDLAKAGVVTVITGFKTELADNPVEGVDTIQFNAMADAFITKFNEDEINLEEFTAFFQQIQVMMEDKELDAEEVEEFKLLMADYYPELEEYLTPPEMPDTLFPEEETTTE